MSWGGVQHCPSEIPVGREAACLASLLSYWSPLPYYSHFPPPRLLPLGHLLFCSANVPQHPRSSEDPLWDSRTDQGLRPVTWRYSRGCSSLENVAALSCDGQFWVPSNPDQVNKGGKDNGGRCSSECGHMVLSVGSVGSSRRRGKKRAELEVRSQVRDLLPS